MKTWDTPPPVHVHVPETTPVHVHMRRSPSKSQQGSTSDAQMIRHGGRPKEKKPWIPPGRLSCRRDAAANQCQVSAFPELYSGGIQKRRVQPRLQSGHQQDSEEREEDIDAMSKSISVLLREQENSRPNQGQQRERDVLLRALVEAEIDGAALANQLAALKETVDGITKEKRLLKSHTSSVARQQDLLFEKIEVFSHTNHRLRELLREWSEYERESLMWAAQKDAFRRKVADSEAENIRLLTKLTNKEKELSKLAEHLDFEKEKTKTTEELTRILQSTRDHLESELNRMESEKAHLAAQIQRMQQSYKQKEQELQAQQGEMYTLRQQIEKEDEARGRQDREELTLLTQQAERAEDSARQLAAKLQEKESQLAQALSKSSDWCLRHSKEAAAKGHLEEEVQDLKLQVSDLNSQLHMSVDKVRLEREELMDQLHHLSAENTSTKLDNQRLKGLLTSSEEKLKDLQTEARHLKASLKKQDNLVEKYKKKVQQLRLDSEEHCLKLEVTQKEAQEVRMSLEREKEQVRRELLAYVRELETLTEKLRRAEQQRRDAEQEVQAQERRNMEHSVVLAEVRHKVEQQGTQLETSQQRNLLLQEENNLLKEKLHSLERRMEDVAAENETLSQTLSAKEASVQRVQQQLEEKTHECSVLSRQLQQTLDDTQKEVENNVQRVLAKERVSQSKALDLQSQLNRAKTEQSQLKRSKDEMERRYQSQLQSMKERLEQSDCTNRSLQNYVQFLKTSYGNVFGDSLLTS